MKTIQQINRLIPILMIIILSGCEDFLDRYPKTSITENSIYSSIDVAESALIGLYNDLQSGNLTGRSTLLRGDYKGNDLFLLIGLSQTLGVEYDYRENINNYGTAGNIWAQGYETIKDCNVFIDGINNIDGEVNVINDMIAQAKTIKAIAYIELVKTFCYPPSMSALDNNKYSMGVPIAYSKDDNVNYIEDGPRRAPLNEVFAHIEDLLQDALQKIDPSRSTGSFVSRYSISGLLAEVYMYQEKWTESASATIDASKGGNMIDYDNFLDNYHLDENNECILEIMYTSTDNLQYMMPAYVLNKTVNENNRLDQNSVGYGDAGVSDAFMNLLMENPNDIRLQLLREDKLSTAPPDLLPPYVHGVDGFSSRSYYKYVGGKEGNVFLHNVPIIRIPEVLLMAAEAYSELEGQDAVALDYLNQVYSKRTGTNLSGLSGDDLKDAIFNERRRELIMEGHNIWDYLRKNRSFTRDNSHFTPVTIDPTTAAGRDGEDFHKVVAPIPIPEMDANPNIRDQQNPGYASYQGSN